MYWPLGVWAFLEPSVSGEQVGVAEFPPFPLAERKPSVLSCVNLTCKLAVPLVDISGTQSGDWGSIPSGGVMV